MNAPRRLRLVGAAPREARNLTFAPIRVPLASLVVAECVEGAGAVAFAVAVAEVLSERGQAPYVVAGDFESVPSLASAHTMRFKALGGHFVAACIASEEDFARSIEPAGELAPRPPLLLVGEPALFMLDGALKVVIDRDGAPEGLSARARRMRAAAHLVLSSPRAEVARLLAHGWFSPTPAP